MLRRVILENKRTGEKIVKENIGNIQRIKNDKGDYYYELRKKAGMKTHYSFNPEWEIISKQLM